MDLKLHANATTTPKTRRLIQSSLAPVSVLARQLGVSETTIRRWRARNQVADRSHKAHRLAISHSPLEEHLVAELRKVVRLGLDDIVEVMHRCVRPDISRSAIYRSLRRQGIAGREPKLQSSPSGQFEPTAPGFVHIDLKHLAPLQGVRAYAFVAIERTTRFAHVEIIENRQAQTIAACLERFLKAFGFPVHTILTDNGSEFTDRFAVDKKGKPEGNPSGSHPFDSVCKQHGIQHRLTKPFHPQTNGMVERFNRRITKAIADHPKSGKNRGKNTFASKQERNQYIEQFVKAYNHTRLRCLSYAAPLQILNNLTKHYTKAGAHASTPTVADKSPWVPAQGRDDEWALSPSRQGCITAR